MDISVLGLLPVFPAASLISVSQRLFPEPGWSDLDASCTNRSQIHWFGCWQISAFLP